MRHFRSELHLPIKSTQGFAYGERKYLPQGLPTAPAPFRVIARWLRIYLRGRRRVDVDALKVQAQRLTEKEWLAALWEPPVAHWRPGKSIIQETDVATIPDPRGDPSETFYLRQLLETVEQNLMSDEVPYFRAILDKTPASELAAALNANPSTTSKRMRQVRIKARSIIAALNSPDSS
jgi:hypothetical protein